MEVPCAGKRRPTTVLLARALPGLWARLPADCAAASSGGAAEGWALLPLEATPPASCRVATTPAAGKLRRGASVSHVSVGSAFSGPAGGPCSSSAGTQGTGVVTESGGASVVGGEACSMEAGGIAPSFSSSSSSGSESDSSSSEQKSSSYSSYSSESSSKAAVAPSSGLLGFRVVGEGQAADGFGASIRNSAAFVATPSIMDTSCDDSRGLVSCSMSTAPLPASHVWPPPV
mmetsp:Transcript_43875/g.139737  ORF Transcript_43875/g.139737 Transcript_43875/m.139737 type:complete len:231 (-) Transcript_43875:933-1625(-)